MRVPLQSNRLETPTLGADNCSSKINRPAFQGTCFNIGCKGFRSIGANERGLPAQGRSEEQLRKRIRTESEDDGDIDPQVDDDASHPKRMRCYNTPTVAVPANPKQASSSPEIHQEPRRNNVSLDVDQSMSADVYLENDIFTPGDILNYALFDELQDFDFWFNGVTLH